MRPLFDPTGYFRSMAAFDGLTPPVKWAQRSDSIYLTVALSDIKDEKIELTGTVLSFRGKSEGRDYVLTLEFLYAVLPEVGSRPF